MSVSIIFMVKSFHHGDLRRATMDQALKYIQQREEVSFTLREIANDLQVSHTAVYRHFQSKSELLSCIAEEGFDLLSQKFEEVLGSSKSTKIALSKLGSAYINFSLQFPQYYRSMFHPELRCSKGQRMELEVAGQKAFTYLLDVLEQGMKEGFFKKTNLMLAGRFVWSSLHGFCSLQLDGQFESLNTKAALDTAIDGHLKLIESGFLKS